MARSTTCASRSPSPERSSPGSAIGASPLHPPLGASPLLGNGSSSCPDIWCLALLRIKVVSLSPPFGPSPPLRRLLRPLLTSRSALAGASPFQARGEISPGKTHGFRRTAAGSTTLAIGRWSFAVICPLAPARVASYPVSVRQPTASLHASFSCSLAVAALRFARFPAAWLPEDLHLLVMGHAGHTKKGGAVVPPLEDVVAHRPRRVRGEPEPPARLGAAPLYQFSGDPSRQLQIFFDRRRCRLNI